MYTFSWSELLIFMIALVLLIKIMRDNYIKNKENLDE